MKFRPHHLLHALLDFIGVDFTDADAVNQAITSPILRRAVEFDGLNYTAKLFFELLRSHQLCYWDIDTLEAAGKKIRGELRKRHVRIAPLARENKLGRATIRTVGKNPRIRMATLIAIGKPAGFLDGLFSKN